MPRNRVVKSNHFGSGSEHRKLRGGYHGHSRGHRKL